MTKTTQPKSGSEIFVPLNMLKKSPRNVRKVEHTAAEVEGLAASIAANGMLQNLVVEPEHDGEGRETGHYFVTIGEGRRLAQLLRAKRRQIKKTDLIRCVLDTEHDTHEISLAENVIRSSMHPADEFEAFALLHNEKGMAADDIAARFGVTPAVVRQRLKLAAVSPALMAVYREGGMRLEQVMAFTLTDDHTRQQEVWQCLGWDKGADAIRRALTEGQVAASDRRAQFVGVEAYAAAGGVIIRDLFDDENGGYFADPALLDRLVLAKLEQEAQAVRAEGWAWVMVTPEYDFRATSAMRRVYPTEPDLSAKAQRKLEKLAAEYDELEALAESEEMTEAMQARVSQLEREMEALKGQPVYDAADIAAGGAFVSLGYEGGVRVERGFIRKEDEAPASQRREAEQEAAGKDGEVSTALPDRLVAQLTAQRTAALREAVVQRPDMAFIAVVHAFVASTFYVGNRVSCLDMTVRTVYLSAHAAGIDESPQGRACSDRQAELAKGLPGDVQDLWDALLGFTQEQLMHLLAHCAALTVDAVVRPGAGSSSTLKHAEGLAEAVSLDMAGHWQPTAANYLGQVTKAVIVEAVREGVSEEAAAQLADLKKPAMAEAAERLLADKGWLPPVLRSSQQSTETALAA
ncbi:ParB N-terminal domain-containing protein [Bradyrhizobium sp. CSA207]|uniref:ParB/RepB/Spo0J family partition protein n=1 Tax=Bradyrhizobium sp. CSA207 TaxID=2698826 RepID=UPI0023B1FFFF|nr:ParB/RepB/Spo0J family partition protein [Bradyrhizobium sp. CSA207]MDE5441089.1 ParB N-terminal domain-containing protein [Bradyrhizobium sp. CSA207]